MNADDVVDCADFLALSQNVRREDAERADGDLCGDRLVDFLDFPDAVR